MTAVVAWALGRRLTSGESADLATYALALGSRSAVNAAHLQDLYVCSTRAGA